MPTEAPCQVATLCSCNCKLMYTGFAKYTATSFGSNDQLTRGEIALILTRAYKLDGKGTSTNFTDVSATYKPAIDALVKNKITQGKSPSTFGTTDPITRGEIAIFLYRVSLLKQ